MPCSSKYASCLLFVGVEAKEPQETREARLQKDLCVTVTNVGMKESMKSADAHLQKDLYVLVINVGMKEPMESGRPVSRKVYGKDTGVGTDKCARGKTFSPMGAKNNTQGVDGTGEPVQSSLGHTARPRIGALFRSPGGGTRGCGDKVMKAGKIGE
ncbi:hypothetical protein NDU88_002189 [Pleurodeles waltl]|uniref:Uncharacterized protein n=1 Tax=Pleurodeles waltl TaxID=8319 RepID=A0AAV7NFN1_PLEWA|nr:hypothetical protein NDU88_002189 [Pleurodeles waltl]